MGEDPGSNPGQAMFGDRYGLLLVVPAFFHRHAGSLMYTIDPKPTVLRRKTPRNVLEPLTLHLKPWDFASALSLYRLFSSYSPIRTLNPSKNPNRQTLFLPLFMLNSSHRDASSSLYPKKKPYKPPEKIYSQLSSRY